MIVKFFYILPILTRFYVKNEWLCVFNMKRVNLSLKLSTLILNLKQNKDLKWAWKKERWDNVWWL